MLFSILNAVAGDNFGAGGRLSVLFVAGSFMLNLSAVFRSLLSMRPPSSLRRSSVSVAVAIAKSGGGKPA